MKLKELYKQTNNYQGYMEQLWQLVTKDNPGNLDIFKELKSLYSEDEWLDIREKIFALLQENAQIAHLYKYEKLYDRLLEYVLKNRV